MDTDVIKTVFHRTEEEFEEERLHVTADSDLLSHSNLGSDGTGSPSTRSSPSSSSGNDEVDSNHGNESDDEIDVETVDDDVRQSSPEQGREKTFWECYPGLVQFGVEHTSSPVLPIPFGYYGYQPFPIYYPPPPFHLPVHVMTSSMPTPLNLTTPGRHQIPSPTSPENLITKLERLVHTTTTGSETPRKRKLEDTPVSRYSNQQTRSDVRKYRCDVCGKCFSRSNTLVTHKRIHTGDKPFDCDMCGRAFRQPGNLTRHRLTHTPVKPFPCPICRKAFNRASNLQTHMRTHSKMRPYGCVTCGEAFAHKEELKQHTSLHDDERNLHCNICGQTFKQMSQLSQHMHQHTDLLPRRHDVTSTSNSMTS